jgi:uroporphyrinogen-III synthase
MMNHLHILITRPEIQGRELCQRITEHGAHPIHFPTIAFAGPPDEQAFTQALMQLGEQDTLIFISPQAVYASIAHIRKHWPHFPDTVKWAAVGAGTAKALQEAGYNAVLYPDKQQNSEGLLALPEFQHVTDKKIAIIRGAGGREHLDKILAERGASVLPVIAYERILPTMDISDCLSRLKQRAIDVIVCTSYDSIRNLKILLGDAGWPYLQEIPVIVVSVRIKMLAEDLGFRRIWVTRDASQTAILDTLKDVR